MLQVVAEVEEEVADREEEATAMREGPAMASDGDPLRATLARPAVISAVCLGSKTARLMFVLNDDGIDVMMRRSSP